MVYPKSRTRVWLQQEAWSRTEKVRQICGNSVCRWSYRLYDHAVARSDESTHGNDCTKTTTYWLLFSFFFFFFPVRILEPAESKSQEECGEGGEHTTLLRIGDVLRWLCEVGCIRYADPPFECWSPEMNCPDEAPNLRNKSKKHYAHKTKHGLGSIPELFMLDRHFRLDRHRGSVLYNPMMLFSRITACPSASG